MKSLSPIGERLFSIIFWQEHCRCGAIRFSDDPEFLSFGGVIDGQDSRALFQGSVVGPAICRAYIAPITGLVSLNGGEDVLVVELGQRVRCAQDATEAKHRDWRVCGVHALVPLALSEPFVFSAFTMR
jgi:hypothetical protein